MVLIYATNSLADALYGPRGPAMVQRWFAEQVNRTSDMGFAREFADHINLPGVRTADYLHRRIRCAAETTPAEFALRARYRPAVRGDRGARLRGPACLTGLCAS